MHPLHHHKLLHIMSVIRLKAFWYFLLRCLSAYNYIMCKGIKPSSHCLHPPSLPTPPTFQAVASHSLLVPRNFMPFTAPTAANISSCLVISAAKTYRTFRLYKHKSRWVFCLQVSSTSDEQQSENPFHLHVAASDFVHSSSIRSTTFHCIQAGRFGHSWTPPSSATTHSHA